LSDQLIDIAKINFTLFPGKVERSLACLLHSQCVFIFFFGLKFLTALALTLGFMRNFCLLSRPGSLLPFLNLVFGLL